MGRNTRLEAEQTRTRLIQTSWKLFTEKGYDKTSVSTIAKECGVTKGAFYHHFKSKGDILEAVTVWLSESSKELVLAGLENRELNAIRKLDLFMVGIRKWRQANLDVVRSLTGPLMSPASAEIRERIGVATERILVPVLEQIIEQGNIEGTMNTLDISETAHALFRYMQVIMERQMRAVLSEAPLEDKVRVMVGRAETALAIMERMLGVKPGSFTRPEPGYIKMVVQAALEGMGRV